MQGWDGVCSCAALWDYCCCCCHIWSPWHPLISQSDYRVQTSLFMLDSSGWQLICDALRRGERFNLRSHSTDNDYPQKKTSETWENISLLCWKNTFGFFLAYSKRCTARYAWLIAFWEYNNSNSNKTLHGYFPVLLWTRHTCAITSKLTQEVKKNLYLLIKIET